MAATIRHIDDEINAELERVGATSGDTGIAATMDDEWEGAVCVRDGVSVGVYQPQEVLDVLQALPDDAGWQEAWDAIGEATRLDA